MRFLCLVLILAAVTPAAWASPSYVNSRGERIGLIPARDRIAVALPAGQDPARALSGLEELLLEQAVLHSGDLWEVPLAPDSWGHGDSVLADLLDRGAIVRAGAAFVTADTAEPFFLHRGVLVKLREPVDGLPGRLLAPTGLVPVRELGHQGTTFLCHAADAPSALEGSVLASGLREVRWALPDFITPVTIYHQPNDTHYGEQWHHFQPSGAHIHSEEAWDVTLGDSQVIAAVIDTGLEETHPDFDPARIVTGYNVPDGTNDPTPLGDAINCHGTQCSGEIAATIDNNEGVVGVCPGCSLMGVLMFNEGSGASLSDGYLGIQYAVDNGAWVLSCSWGISHAGVDMQPYYDAVLDAVYNGRGGLGSVVLFASGNGDFWGNAEPIPAAAIANLPEVMAVGGTGPDDLHVSYSNYGPNLSVVAPTGGLDNSNPMIATTDTLGTRGASRNGTHWIYGWFGDEDTGWPEPDATGNYTRYFNGTSASCPIAAGVVAMVFSANPGLTGVEARFVVEQTADKVGPMAYDQNGHNNYYGYGRVNVGRAVRAAELGFDNLPGSLCAEDFNCADGTCLKDDPADFYGNCPVDDCTTLPDGTSCIDADLCTQNTTCQGGACVGDPVACDDGNACTDDGCDPASGCLFTDNTSPCDDNNACTENDACSGGSCGGSPIDCDDGDACSSDSCSAATGCVHNPVNCDDGNPCTSDNCEPDTGCIHQEDSCDDGDACTADSCAPWEGCRHQAVDCDDGDACTVDSCDAASGCDHQPADCDDGDPCTQDACEAGAGCTHVFSDAHCDDQNPCTDDSCESGEGCQHAPNTSGCDDGDACTQNDLCAGGSCTGAPVDCSSLDGACARGVCDPGTGACEAEDLADGTACDDGDPCTENDGCTAGDCGGQPKECISANACQESSCDPLTGDCVVANLPDDTACSTGDECVEDQVCQDGECGGGTYLCESSSSCGCGSGRGSAMSMLLVLFGLAALRPRVRN